MQHNVWLIIGKSGTGKTYCTKEIIKRYISRKLKRYVVILDMSSEYRDLVKTHVQITSSLRHLNFEKLIYNKQQIFFEFVDLTEPEIMETVDKIAKAVLTLGNCLFAIDEAHMFFPRYNSSIMLERVLRAGRKYSIDTIITTQIVVDLNITAIKLATILVSFQLTEKNDLQRIAAYFGGDTKILETLSFTCYIAKNLRNGKVERGSTKILTF